MFGIIGVAILMIIVFELSQYCFNVNTGLGIGILVLGLVSIFMLSKIFLVFYGIL